MNKKEHVHFIGIGGYGMSAIAKVILEMGHKVTGSDLAQSDLSRKLVDMGATVYLGHDVSYIEGATTVVYSTALKADNIEIVAAREAGIEVMHRSEMLARLLNDAKGIAVAGAHGKTTTSSMIALVMELAQHDPTFIIGGEIVNLGTNAKAGKSSYVVAEADESDGSFLKYYPSIAVVTNIEADHLENYGGDFENIKKAYVQFLKQVRQDGKVIVCIDDENMRALLPKVYEHNEELQARQLITYGLSSDAHYYATHIVEGDRQVTFQLNHKDQVIGEVKLSVPGIHNVYNALATVIVCLEAGLSLESIIEVIPRFIGAKRRFQVIEEKNDILIVDDYAHHPTEIMATLRAAKATGKKITAVFQPQRFSRTYFLFDEFSQAFPEADTVYVTDIYSPAGEKEIEGVSSSKLVELIRKNGHSEAYYIPTKEEVLLKLKETTLPGDLVITMGAGDIYKVSHALGKFIAEQQ